MTLLVTENLALLAMAPGGIPGLRQLILQLAVHGKLLAQDTADPPAVRELATLADARSETAAKKARSVKRVVRGAIEPPHSVPTSWQWCALADVVQVLNGRAYKKEELLETGTPVLRVGNLFTSNHWYYSNLSLEDDKYCDAGDLIFAWSASFGPFIWMGERVIYHYHIWKLKPHDGTAVSKHYLNLFLQERTQAIKAAGHGVSMAHMTKEKMQVLPVALPPLAEQHRIVAKVDELMALCDRLEARQQDAAAAHAQLEKVLLDCLIQARDADGFQACWQRIAGQFPTLFTSTASINRLWSAVLCLAAEGKLVQAGEQVDHLPIGKLLLGDTLNGCSYKPSDVPIGIPILRISAGTGSDDFIVDETDHKWVEVTAAEREKFRLLPNDLLACRFNGNLHYVGAFALYNGASGVQQIFPDKLIRFRVDDKRALPGYLRFVMNALPARQQIESFCATSVGNIGISATNLKTVKVRVPSLEEQRRIVAKVTELLALCDQLKVRIAAVRAKHAQLAQALVERAVA